MRSLEARVALEGEGERSRIGVDDAVIVVIAAEGEAGGETENKQ